MLWRRKPEEEVCEECVAAKEKSERTEKTDAHLRGCKDEYARVEACMKEKEGRVSDCVGEWKAFRECFAASQRRA